MSRVTVAAALALLLTALPASADEEKDSPDGVAALMAATRGNFLTVRFYARELPPEQREEEDPYSGSLLAGYARREIPLEVTGLALGSGGRVLIHDQLLDMRMIRRIEGELIGGKPFEMVFLGVLPRTTLAVLAPKDASVSLAPVAFSPAPALDGETKLCAVSLILDNDEQVFGGATGSKPMIIRRKGKDAWVYRGLGTGSFLAVVGDEEGRPIGVLPPNFAPESGQEDILWVAKDLEGQPLYAAEKIVADRQRAAAKLGEAAFKITFTFRAESGRSGGSYYPGSGQEGNDREQHLVGIALDQTHLLVPTMFNRKQAAKVEQVEVQIGEDKHAATLLGALRGARAMIVKLDAGSLPSAVDFTDATDLPWVTPVMNASVDLKYGKVDVRAYMDRCIGKERSFGGAYHFKTLRQFRRDGAAVIMNSQGGILGMTLAKRPPFETIRKIRQYGMSRYGGDSPGDGDVVTFPAVELSGMIRTEPEALDRRIRSLPKDDLYRRAWLGVEVSGLNKKLAEQLEIQKPTRDGELGMLVSVVYPDSPAEKLGIKPSDVLLKITPAGNPDLDVELKSQFAELENSSDYYGDMEIDEIDRGAFVRPVWKARDNFMTSLLDEIGVGEKIELSWLDGQEVKTAPLTIQMAPRDLRSARKATDELTGLTVKELTYEVRQGYKLAPDAGGILVVRAKSASKAALARLGVFSILSKLDDQAITDPDQFISLLEAARKAGKTSVKLFVITPGDSRFADLALK
jgi:S1-C subfamily serine protease